MKCFGKKRELAVPSLYDCLGEKLKNIKRKQDYDHYRVASHYSLYGPKVNPQFLKPVSLLLQLKEKRRDIHDID